MLAYRLTDHLCDISTNVSQEAVDAFIKCGASSADRIIAMHNGIDTECFTFNSKSRAVLRKQLKLTDNIPLILAVGRLTAAKDYPNLLNAFSLLPDKLNNAQLAIIGTGEEKDNIETLTARLGLISRIHFLGLQRNVQEWMSAADIFILSSAWEGFGLVVAEAMSCERVVVATDCGGVKEVIGDCGYLVLAKNSAALSARLLSALELPSEEKSILGENARKRVISKYSIYAQVDKWIELYSDYSLK
ncbi:MAG: glycosyltransferase [Aeromonas sp.]